MAAIESAVIEVPKQTTPKKKPAIAERLENSPRKVATPEDIKARQQRADARRESMEAERRSKLHNHLEKVKETSRRLRLEKENSPAPSPVKQ